MTDQNGHGESNGQVVPIRADPVPDEPALAQAPAPAYADITDAQAGKRKPIVPLPLQRQNLRGTVTEAAGLHGHRVLFHGIRLPWHTARILFFAVLGFGKLTARLTIWWHWTHGWAAESQAVAAGRSGHGDLIRVHTEGKKTRKARAQIIGAVLAGAVILGLAAYQWMPAWGWAVLAAAAVLVLALVGKPKGKPLVTAATVPPKYEPPDKSIICRALGSLGIAAINEGIRNGTFGPQSFTSDVHRDGPGWGAQLDLPYGVTPTQVLARRESLASGLRRPVSATWPAGVDGEHAGRLELWIGFHDMSKTRQPAWPLLRSGEADVFAGIPFGTDPRGRNITAQMFEVNWLIGAAPGQGKTAAVRVLGCGAALDPLADLWIHELAGKGDLEPLAQVCHRYTSGLDDESVGYTAASLAMLRTEMDRRSAAFKKLPREMRPEGKVTRAMAERRGLRLRPLVCIIDEAQNAFMHPTMGAKAADDAAYVIRLGRAYGVIVILATQRPDSISLPTAISGIVTARFCLKVPDQPANDMILGTGSYKAGYNAAIFRAKTDAGLGWLKGDGDPQVARTYYLDDPVTGRVATRARAIRERAGVLSGVALGEEGSDGPARSFAADVLTVFGTDPALWSETIATRLRESIADAYTDITRDAVASQLRGLGVNVRDVREGGGGNRKGAYRSEVEAVASTGGV